MDLTNIPHLVITPPNTTMDEPLQQSSSSSNTPTAEKTTTTSTNTKNKKGLGKIFLINEDFVPKPLVAKLNAGELC